MIIFTGVLYYPIDKCPHVDRNFVINIYASIKLSGQHNSYIYIYINVDKPHLNPTYFYQIISFVINVFLEYTFKNIR